MLNTFVGYSDAELAGLLFHELAHQVVYLRDDTEFNESFATAVETEGVRRWLETHGRADEMEAFHRARRREETFVELVLEARGRLAAVYASDEADEQKRRSKERALDDLRQAWATTRAEEGEAPGYDAWFAQPLNNAHLASVGAYHGLVPAFEDLLAACRGDLGAFYDEVRRIAALPPAQRAAELRRGP